MEKNKYLSHFREIGGIQHCISAQNDVDFPPISLNFDKFLLIVLQVFKKNLMNELGCFLQILTQSGPTARRPFRRLATNGAETG
jgi:hypothetical protein